MTITEPVRAPSSTSADVQSTWDVAEAYALREQINPDTNRPWTNADLARKYGVSKQAVGQRLKRYYGETVMGGSVEKTRLLPWRVKQVHNDSYLTVTLRLLARRDRGERLTATQMRMVDSFLAKLRDMGDMVVYYDEDKASGYVLRPRRKEDGKAIMVTTK